MILMSGEKIQIFYATQYIKEFGHWDWHRYEITFFPDDAGLAPTPPPPPEDFSIWLLGNLGGSLNQDNEEPHYAARRGA
jgi:hypothetical protein